MAVLWWANHRPVGVLSQQAHGFFLKLLPLFPQPAFRQLRLQQFCLCQFLGSGDEVGGIINVIDGAFGFDLWADGCGSHNHERQRHLLRGFTASLSFPLTVLIVVGDVDDPCTAELHQFDVAINDQPNLVSVTWLADGDVSSAFSDVTALFTLKFDDPEILDWGLPGAAVNAPRRFTSTALPDTLYEMVRQK